MIKKIFLKYIWYIILFGILILHSLFQVIQISFISTSVNFYYKISVIILIMISMKKTLFDNSPLLKMIVTILSILLICFYSFSHMLLENDLYVTTIKNQNNNNELVIQEHFLMEEWSISFYKQTCKIFKKPLVKSFNFIEDYNLFYDKKYKYTWIDDKTVRIEFEHGGTSHSQKMLIIFE